MTAAPPDSDSEVVWDTAIESDSGYLAGDIAPPDVDTGIDTDIDTGKDTEISKDTGTGKDTDPVEIDTGYLMGLIDK